MQDNYKIHELETTHANKVYQNNQQQKVLEHRNEWCR